MKIKTSELIDDALDWAVGMAEGRTLQRNPMGPMGGHGWWIWEETPSGQGGIILSKSVYLSIGKQWSPTTNRAQGGPIMEREGVSVFCGGLGATGYWNAYYADRDEWHDVDLHKQVGPTPLVAGMRCYVASKLGDEVEVPDELLQFINRGRIHKDGEPPKT
jgi:hypothetical protein